MPASTFGNAPAAVSYSNRSRVTAAFLLLRIDAVREQQLYLGAKVAGFLNRTVGGASQLLGVLLKAMAGLL